MIQFQKYPSVIWCIGMMIWTRYTDTQTRTGSNVYNGQWKENKRTGRGVMTYSNDGKYYDVIVINDIYYDIK